MNDSLLVSTAAADDLYLFHDDDDKNDESKNINTFARPMDVTDDSDLDLLQEDDDDNHMSDDDDDQSTATSPCPILPPLQRLPLPAPPQSAPLPPLSDASLTRQNNTSNPNDPHSTPIQWVDYLPHDLKQQQQNNNDCTAANAFLRASLPPDTTTLSTAATTTHGMLSAAFHASDNIMHDDDDDEDDDTAIVRAMHHNDPIDPNNNIDDSNNTNNDDYFETASAVDHDEILLPHGLLVAHDSHMAHELLLDEPCLVTWEPDIYQRRKTLSESMKQTRASRRVLEHCWNQQQQSAHSALPPTPQQPSSLSLSAVDNPNNLVFLQQQQQRSHLKQVLADIEQSTRVIRDGILQQNDDIDDDDIDSMDNVRHALPQHAGAPTAAVLSMHSAAGTAASTTAAAHLAVVDLAPAVVDDDALVFDVHDLLLDPMV